MDNIKYNQDGTVTVIGPTKGKEVPFGINQELFDNVKELEVKINKLKSLLLNSNYGNWNFEENLQSAEIQTLIQIGKVEKLIHEDLN